MKDGFVSVSLEWCHRSVTLLANHWQLNCLFNRYLISRPHGRAMRCLLWGFGRRLTFHRTVYCLQLYCNKWKMDLFLCHYSDVTGVLHCWLITGNSIVCYLVSTFLCLKSTSEFPSWPVIWKGFPCHAIIMINKLDCFRSQSTKL